MTKRPVEGLPELLCCRTVQEYTTQTHGLITIAVIRREFNESTAKKEWVSKHDFKEDVLLFFPPNSKEPLAK